MKPSLFVATWNVLHRVHAENWGEAPAQRFADERPRTAAISAQVVARLEGGCEAIGLQEVSGDQLASLRESLPAGTTLHVLRYPRMPRAHEGQTHLACLADASEHLVVLVAPGSSARMVEAAAFPDDGGKGLLAVELDGRFLVVDTHVSFGPRRDGQLARIAALARAAATPVVVLGDFNAERAVVGAALGADFAFALPAPTALPTRPRERGDRSQTIDHVVVHGARPLEAAVVDVDGLSDHNLVWARIAG